MTTCAALIFAKYPQPGAVKTRLAERLSTAQAALIHRASLIAVCENVASIPGLEPILLATPDDRVGELREIVGNRVKQCRPQGSGDLGVRLVRATQGAFATGFECVLLLGSDSPTLPPTRLNEAVDLLDNHDAVLGPCDDGGYYVLGLRSAVSGWRTLFQRIDWGSERVADQTRARAAAGDIDLRELALWYDLDRFADLVRAAADLRSVTDPSRPAIIELRRVIEDFTKTP